MGSFYEYLESGDLLKYLSVVLEGSAKVKCHGVYPGLISTLTYMIPCCLAEDIRLTLLHIVICYSGYFIIVFICGVL